MTPDRLRQCLEALDWSQTGLSVYLGMSSATTVKRWATGQQTIPHHVAAWLETLAQHHERHPFPDGWQHTRPSRPAQAS